MRKGITPEERMENGLVEIALEEVKRDVEKWHSPFSKFKRWVRRI